MTVLNYKKESYITARNSPDQWRNHVNVKTLEAYSKYISGNVLDVGCNHAASTFWLGLFDITHIHGIDINQKSIYYADRTFLNFEKQFRKIPYQFDCLNLVNSRLEKTFNTITSFHVLEHIYPEDTKKFLTNIFEMLSDDGYFIIGIPYERAYTDPCHVSFYNERTLTELMEDVGFKTIECFKDDRFNEKNILTGLFRKKQIRN